MCIDKLGYSLSQCYFNVVSLAANPHTIFFLALDYRRGGSRGIGWLTNCWCFCCSLLSPIGSSTSITIGIGVLDLVTRWWICFVARTTLGAVVLFDVDADSATLSCWLSPTPGGWPPCMMGVSCLRILMCLTLFSADGTAIFSSLSISLAANIDWSASDMVGI